MVLFCPWFSVYLSETWNRSHVLFFFFSGRLKIKTLLWTQWLCHPSLLTMRRWNSADAIIQPTLLILLTFTQTHALDYQSRLEPRVRFTRFLTRICMCVWEHDLHIYTSAGLSENVWAAYQCLRILRYVYRVISAHVRCSSFMVQEQLGVDLKRLVNPNMIFFIGFLLVGRIS